ncbi:MAG: nicotinate (nicotinamide) nucleotide adenylyltransferase [candidate division NC10 bacterium]
MPRVGVFGGSFNPIHLGHLLLAEDILELLRLDRILFVPASAPPHKPARGLAPARDRYAMTELAIRGNPRFAMSDLELRRPGPSYTVDTLEALRQEGGPDVAFFLLIGSETFLDLLSWRDPQRVARLARLVVIPRAESARFASRIMAPFSSRPRAIWERASFFSFVEHRASARAASLAARALASTISRMSMLIPPARYSRTRLSR